MPYITVREYHPETGALLGNVTTLNFGRITAGNTSAVKVIDIAFTEVSGVGNVKLGLIADGGLIVNSNPTDITNDGTASNGHFGIESSSSFDSAKASAPLSRHFSGVNADISASNSNNALIPNRTATLSNYIYLDIEIDSSSIGAGNGAYKIFFDYS